MGQLAAQQSAIRSWLSITSNYRLIVFVLLVHWLYDQECCEQQHCHPVPCEQISDTKSGWIWRDGDWLAVHFARNQLKVSPDGNCHVCVAHLTDTPVLHGICIYLPSRV
jgi:hypothetical protein